MKLHELKAPTSLTEQIDLIWEDKENLDEGIWDTMRSGFSQISNSYNTIRKNVDQKGELNDVVLRKIYIQELDKFKDAYDIAPEKVKTVVDGWLSKAGIKISGVDTSRKNFNRIMILKVLRLIMFTVSQMRDNGVQWLISTAVSGGISTIVGLLMNAKDVKSVGAEMVNTSKQLKTLFDKANSQQPTQPPEE